MEVGVFHRQGADRIYEGLPRSMIDVLRGPMGAEDRVLRIGWAAVERRAAGSESVYRHSSMRPGKQFIYVPPAQSIRLQPTTPYPAHRSTFAAIPLG